jgi:hypothetical protein
MQNSRQVRLGLCLPCDMCLLGESQWGKKAESGLLERKKRNQHSTASSAGDCHGLLMVSGGQARHCVVPAVPAV